ncbi:MAG: ABC transporter substrate-binding protein [Thermodesulfobacteriota bacterium]
MKPFCRLFLPCLVLLLAGAGFSSARAGEPLRFAYQNRVGDAVPIVAVSRNFFAAEGLEVKALQFNNGPACAEALVTGGVDLATMGDTAAVLALARDSTLRILGSHGAGEKRHRIVVPQHSPLRSVADLKGRRIGIKKGTSTHGGFLALLAAQGITPGELTMTDLDPALMPDALAAGSLDAFAASEPTPSLAEMKGGRELADLGGLGNNYPLLLLAKDSLLRKRDAELHRFFRALARAEAFIRQEPAAAAAILSKETGLFPALATKAMALHSYRLQLDGVTLASLKQIAAFLKEQKKIDRLPDFTAMSRDRYLPVMRDGRKTEK